MKTTTLRWRIAQWLEIRWWQNYLAKQNPEKYRTQKADYWQRLLAALQIKMKPKERVLDAGCGPAGVFLVMDQQETVAVDPLLEQYEEQLAHFSPAFYPEVQFHSLPLEDFQSEQAFDTIFCLNAINHVNDWDLGLDRLTEAAQLGTRLVLGIDVHNHRLLRFIFKALPGDVLHPHQHDRADYHEALAKRGWKIDREHTWSKGFIFDYWLVVAEKTR